MLTNAAMGAVCLGVVWLNTLLIAMHVAQAWRALRRERRALGTVVHAKVIEAHESGSLAELRVAQIGRAITTDGPSRILFTEASRTAQVHEGAVEIAGERVVVRPIEDARAWVVGDAGEREETDFDVAFRSANTNRGFTSELVVALGASGTDVWLAGDREEAMRVRIVSDSDPRVVLASGARRALAFISVAIALLVGITALALVRPWFSGLSTLGGMLAVAYFLSVQPLAVALREAIAPPDQRKIGGIWRQ